MVAKISSNNSLFGTLLYNQKKIEKDEAKLLSSKNVYERTEGSFSMQTTLKSFEPYLVANKRTEKPIFHVSLNPSPKDNLTDEQYREIADRYMKDMGYENQPYVVFKHTDIARMHLHIVSTRVGENGKKLDSNFENMRSMKICRQIEQDFKLSPANKQEEKEDYSIPLKPINYKDGDIKSQIGNFTKAMMANYNFQSLGEYRTLLEQCNVTVEELKGVRNGQAYQGLLYSATDDKGNKVGVPIKASKIGKSVGYEALQKKFEKSKMNIDKNKTREYLSPIIKNALSKSYNLDDLRKLLLANNINPILRINEQGRLYGVSFIDYHNKTIMNGSRLGKEFSANALGELFANKSIIEKPQNINSSQYERVDSDNSIDFSLGLSLFEQHGEDWENERFVRRKEIERKKRGRRF